MQIFQMTSSCNHTFTAAQIVDGIVLEGSTITVDFSMLPAADEIAMEISPSGKDPVWILFVPSHRETLSGRRLQSNPY